MAPTAPLVRKRAFSTLGDITLGLFAAMDLARRHGLDGIELRGLDGALDIVPGLERSLGTPLRASAGDVAIVALGSSLRLAENDDRQREELLRLAPWADALGTPHIRVFDGARLLEPGPLARAVDTLRWWEEQRASNGWKVDVMVETHDTLLDTPSTLAFLNAAPANTRLLWDTHHTWRRGGEMPGHTWRAIRDNVAHLHVKDSRATHSGRNSCAYVPCGQGIYPMRELRTCLDRDGFDGFVSLEWERHWHPDLPPLEEAIVSAREHLWW